jgi:hypothetical protein
MTAVGAGQLERARVRTGAVAAPRKKPFPWQTAIVHALLIACIAVVAFPLYYAFVISTQNIQEVIQRPPLLYTSSHLIENYAEAWRKVHMGRMLFNSFVMGVLQGRSSSPCCRPSPSSLDSAAACSASDDLPHAHVVGPCASCPPEVVGTRLAQHLPGADHPG